MKHTISVLSSRYLDALRGHLGGRRPSGAAAARRLGRDAIGASLSALDLARMHDRSLGWLAGSSDFTATRNGHVRRAANFFTAALAPVEKAHRTTRESFEQLQQRATVQRRHLSELARGNRLLRTEVTRRKAGEAAVKRGKERYHQLLMRSQVMQEKLRHLARQILSVQEEERREISRELHDEVVQTLVGINVQLSALGSAASIGIRALKAKIALTQRLVEKSVNAVHQFARELRPAVLDDLGLIPALQALMKTIAVQKKLQIRLVAFAGVELLDNKRRTVLYRVAQEALTNVVRHAHASSVDVNIAKTPIGLCMVVHDNGKSFEVSRMLSATTNRRLGLVGMRERVEMVGGTLLITSAPGQGTTVRAEIPHTRRGAK